MTPNEAQTDGATRGLLALALAALVGFAAWLRSIGSENVFLADGRVVFANSDAFYHARRGLYNLAQFPDFLKTDSCINFPDGASVPHPPGYDFLVAVLAKLAGGELADLEQLAAWLPVLLGALGVLPVFALGRIYAGRAVGLAAAFIYCVLPIAINYSRVGNADHHAAAALLGATLLATYASVLTDRTRPAIGFAILMATRAAMLLVWHGSLLYLAVGEPLLVLAAAVLGRRDWLRGQALSCLGSALLVMPVVAMTALPRDGLYSATELSRLPVLLLLVNAGVCAALAFGMQTMRVVHARGRVSFVLTAAVVFAGVSLAIPGVIEGLRPAFEFLSKSDAWGGSVLEQLPLFHEHGELRAAAGEKWLGGIAYLLPLIPLAFVPLLDDSRLRAVAALGIVWSLIFGVLAFSQVRYANDYAAVASVGAALGIALFSRWLAARTFASAAPFYALLLGALLLSPLWPRYFSFVFEASLEQQRGDSNFDRALLTLEGTQLRFAERVRELTPDTPGCGSEPGVPDYGVLAHPAIGHVLHYVAGRATPADPFGPYIGRRNFDLMRRAWSTSDESEFMRIAEQLRTRYVLTADDGGDADPQTIVSRLHAANGSASASAPQLGQLRLLAAGPKGGVPIALVFEDGAVDRVPYKLFEIVPGALLEVAATPGSRVTATISVRATQTGRFRYTATGVADDRGVARLRVPYATDAVRPGSNRSSYTISAEGRRWKALVPEAAVAEGRVVATGPARDQ